MICVCVCVENVIVAISYRRMRDSMAKIKATTTATWKAKYQIDFLHD